MPTKLKTEIIAAFARVLHVRMVGTLTLPALLTGAPKKQFTRGAEGAFIETSLILYIPIVTGLLVSLVLTLFFWVFNR